MIDKERQHTFLKGMSPDLFDNVIMLCGGTCYDCYRILRDDAGMMRKTLSAKDMLAMLNVNHGVESQVDTRVHRVKKITNATNILNIISSI